LFFVFFDNLDPESGNFLRFGLFNILKDKDENLTFLSDEALMLRCRKGEIECLNILIGRHKNSLYRYIFSMIREEAISEEIFQDVFLQVLKFRRKYKPKAKFTTFLFKIAHNRCINEVKHRKVIESKKPDSYQIDMETPLNKMLMKERKKIFYDSIDKLSPKLQSVYVLREIQELSYSEIGAIQKCSVGTVKSRLNRARDKLCEELKKYEL